MDFRVPRPKLLFTSRPQFSCRNSIHVTTSISCRDINLCPCWFQLIACDVVTSWSCRNIHSSTLQSSIVALDVATSLLLSRHHFKSSAAFQPVVLGVATSVFLSRHRLEFQHLHSPRPVVASRQFTCRDKMMLSRHHSLSFRLILSCLSS